MFEIYKSRKANLILRIKESKSLYETGSVISEAFETMQYQYLRDNKDSLFGEKVGDLMTMAKTAVPLIESVSKYKMWENAEGEAPKKKSPFPGMILLLTGMAFIFVPVAYHMFIQNFTMNEFRGYLTSMLIGCITLMVSGFMLFFRRKIKNKANVEIYVNAEDIANRIEEIIKNIDTLLEKEKHYIKQQENLVCTHISDEEYQLYSYLLEAKLSGDGEFALEQIERVEEYLAQQNVIILNYSKGNEKYFDFLEGDTKTIRPALIRGGEIMKKGLAQIRE